MLNKRENNDGMKNYQFHLILFAIISEKNFEYIILCVIERAINAR